MLSTEYNGIYGFRDNQSGQTNIGVLPTFRISEILYCFKFFFWDNKAQKVDPLAKKPDLKLVKKRLIRLDRVIIFKEDVEKKCVISWVEIWSHR